MWHPCPLGICISKDLGDQKAHDGHTCMRMGMGMGIHDVCEGVEYAAGRG